MQKARVSYIIRDKDHSRKHKAVARSHRKATDLPPDLVHIPPRFAPLLVLLPQPGSSPYKRISTGARTAVHIITTAIGMVLRIITSQYHASCRYGYAKCVLASVWLYASSVLEPVCSYA
eukprot:2083817-Rhodomonas_salina.2